MAVRAQHLLLAVLAVTAVALVLVPPSRAATPGIYWGALIDDHLTGTSPPYDMTAVDAFESLVGKQVSLVEFSLPWAQCATLPCRFDPFPAKQMQAIRDHGSIPFFGWASYSQPLSENQPDFQLSKIIDGDYDAFIRQWAQDARAWGHPFFLNFNWEMNLAGIWTYVETVNGNRRGDYVKAWRHVHDIIESEGAKNVTWVWCPNSAYDAASSDIAPLYPGDAYVDWTCIDAYNWPWNWQSFADMLGPTYDMVQAIAPDKPMLMGETASTEKGGSKSAWITDMLERQIPARFPNLKGFVWFEKKEAILGENSPSGWEVESSPSALAAFQNGIASPLYAGATFGSLNESPIPPLTPVVLPPKPDDRGGGPVIDDGPCRTAAQQRTAACRRGAIIRGLKVKPRIRRTLDDTLPAAPSGASISFQLLTEAQVTLRFSRWSGGRYRSVPGAITLAMTKGKRAIAFSGRLAARRTLPAGRYRMTAGAVDSVGRQAKSVGATFVLYAPGR